MILLCISFCCCCLPIFSSAQEVVHYASIPRPVNSDDVKYIIADNPSQSYCTFYRISLNALDLDTFNIFFAADNSDVKLMAYNTGSISYDVFIDRFNLDGQHLGSYVITVPSGGLPNTVTLLNFDSDYVGYLDIGDIPLQEGSETSSFGVPSVAWSDATDPDTYTQWLDRINSTLDDINTDTSSIDDQLKDVNSQLDLFYSLFNSYQMQQHHDLLDIYNKVSDIYDLMSEEASTYAPVEESEIDEFLSAEAELNKDYSADLENQFQSAGSVFDNNSAYSFISNLFSNLLLSNTSINSLIIFALAIGLCILVLGRRLNV